MPEHLAAPGERFLFQLFQRHHGIDQSHVQRFPRVVLPAQVPDFPSLFLAHDARQVGGAETAVKGADLGARLAEFGVVRGDGEVADDMEDVPTADGVAGHHGDDGLGHGADGALHIQNIQARHAVFTDVAGISAHFLVAAGAEGVRAFPGQDDHAHLGVFMRGVEGVEHFMHGLGTERVADLGAVDRDFRDAAVVRCFILDIRIFPGGGPLCAHADYFNKASVNGKLKMRRLPGVCGLGRGERRRRAGAGVFSAFSGRQALEKRGRSRAAIFFLHPGFPLLFRKASR